MTPLEELRDLCGVTLTGMLLRDFMVLSFSEFAFELTSIKIVLLFCFLTFSGFIASFSFSSLIILK